MNPYQFFIASFIYYVAQMLNIYLAVKYYQEGYIVHFAIYLILVVLEKVVSFFQFRRFYNSDECFRYLFLDYFYLGFLIPYSQVQDRLQFLINVKAVIILYPLVLLQSFLLMDKSEEGFSTFIIINYAVYVIQMLLISFYTFNYRVKKFRILHSIATHFSYFMSLKHMINSYDAFGINLGFYCLLISIINAIIFFIQIPYNRDQTNYYVDYNMYQFIGCNAYNYYHIINTSTYLAQKDDQQVYISRYLAQLNQFFRLAIILVYIDSQLWNEIIQVKNIYMLNLILVIIFSLLFFIVYSKKIWNQLFKKKLKVISSNQDFFNVAKYLQVQHTSVQKIYIYLFVYEDYQCSNKKENESLTQRDHSRCPYYQLQKGISFQLQQEKDITVTDFSTKIHCSCSLKKLLSEEELVEDSTVYSVSKFLYPIITLERYSNGLLFTQVTSKLMHFTYQRDEEIILMELKSAVLELLAGIKFISPEMIMLPQLVIYDLYQYN